MAGFVPWELAEDLTLLAHDPLDVTDVAVDLVERAAVMDCQAEQLVFDGELAHHHRTEFDGRIHQVLQVGRGELER